MLKRAIYLFFPLVVIFFLSSHSVSASTGYKYSDCPYGVGLYGSCLSFAGPPHCNDPTPGAPPLLYGAVPKDGNSIELYFTEGQNPYSHYALEYGTASGKYIFAAKYIGDRETRKFLVQSLSPNTTYYFRVRTGNGCATGTWSNEISARTKGFITRKDLTTTSLELTPGEETEEGQEMYEVKVKVINTEGNPVEDALVTLESKVLSATTNKEGMAIFAEVPKGEHKITIAHNGYSGEQNVNLDGDVKTFEIKITIEPKNIVFSRTSLIIIGILISLLVLLAFKKRSRNLNRIH